MFTSAEAAATVHSAAQTRYEAELAFVRRVRRAIHRRPELGHHEYHTARLIERILTRMGLSPFRPAFTSVAVVIGPAGSAPVAGFRADIDALPVSERSGVFYSSRNLGVMHACGHDGHTAALLTLARRLILEPPRQHSVLLVFQEAEEGYPSGAPTVLEGIPAGLMPPEFFAFHLWPELPERVVGLRTGPMMASVAGLTFDITGQAGVLHGTRSEADGTDAVRAGTNLYLRLAPNSGRVLDEQSPTAISLGRIVGGEAPNRVALHCRLEGTLRALSRADEEQASTAIRSVAREVSDESGARIEVMIRSGIRPPVCNDAGSVDRIRSACGQLGVTCLDYPDRPVGASEDFGWFLERAGGALFLLGCARSHPHPNLHSPEFDFDEEVLLTGVDLLHALAGPADPHSTESPEPGR
jgi:amidohydrolase